MTRPFFAPRSSRWVPGNHFELLENGEEFFPRVLQLKMLLKSNC